MIAFCHLLLLRLIIAFHSLLLFRKRRGSKYSDKPNRGNEESEHGADSPTAEQQTEQTAEG